MSSDLELCTKINHVVGSINLCSGKVEYEDYGYNVRRWTAGLFVALFGLSACGFLDVVTPLNSSD